jgi:hypothetical protein
LPSKHTSHEHARDATDAENRYTDGGHRHAPDLRAVDKRSTIRKCLCVQPTARADQTDEAGQMARHREHPLRAGDRVTLTKFPFRGKRRRAATLIRPKKWFGQRAWLVDLDGGWVSSGKPGSVRTTVTERVMQLRDERLAD